MNTSNKRYCPLHAEFEQPLDTDVSEYIEYLDSIDVVADLEILDESDVDVQKFLRKFNRARRAKKSKYSAKWLTTGVACGGLSMYVHVLSCGNNSEYLAVCASGRPTQFAFVGQDFVDELISYKDIDNCYDRARARRHQFLRHGFIVRPHDIRWTSGVVMT